MSPWCPGCGGDLRPLVQVVDLANHHFNEALRAARAGDWHRAAEQGTVTLALRPDDADAVVLLAKIARRQGRRDRSQQLWRRALELAPQRPDIQRALEEGSQPLPPWQRMVDLAPSRQQIAAAAPSRHELAERLYGAIDPDGELRRALTVVARWATEYGARIRSRARRRG
ncbi:MAG: tetratricopeptide repeat protein [Pseudonocardiaceae bacterium]